MAIPQRPQDLAVQREHNPLAHINEENPLADQQIDGRWEQDLKFEIPEFHGGQSFHDEKSAAELLHWIVTVEETLEFKRVPLEHCVPMIAMRFRGRAAAWWSQLKSSRARSGKPKISSWGILKKKMRKTFLPFNNDKAMFKRFENLKQGSLSVVEYSTEFFALSARVDLRFSNKQLVERFVGGLQKEIKYEVGLMNPRTVAEAHQRSLTVEAKIKERFDFRMNIVKAITLAFGVRYFIVYMFSETKKEA